MYYSRGSRPGRRHRGRGLGGAPGAPAGAPRGVRGVGRSRGAGVFGAAAALAAARRGLRVVVLDRGLVAGGTTGAGEGNVLVSDKEPGPELDLALLSLPLWADVAEHVGSVLGAGFEFE